MTNYCTVVVKLAMTAWKTFHWRPRPYEPVQNDLQHKNHEYTYILWTLPPHRLCLHL